MFNRLNEQRLQLKQKFLLNPNSWGWNDDGWSSCHPKAKANPVDFCQENRVGFYVFLAKFVFGQQSSELRTFDDKKKYNDQQVPLWAMWCFPMKTEVCFL